MCSVCNKHFFTRYSILHHLSASSKYCKTYYHQCFEPIDPALQETLDNEESKLSKKLRKEGKSRFYHEFSTVRLSGPLRRKIDFEDSS